MTLPFDFAPKAPPPPPSDEKPKSLSVGELSRLVKRTLDLGFERDVWVEGEVTGTRPASSGHLYFALKDEREEAVVDVVMYRASLTQRARRLVADGAKVRVRGRPTYWAPRGRLQFVADRAEPVGKGALLEALERLKAKLAEEGLFADERKRRLPEEPRIIGVVTSRDGAVIHDICKVAFRRGGAHVLLCDAQVQGAGATLSIQHALATLQRLRKVDVIIVGRGGGSTDDLAAFNDEAVVRAVAACRVPVVSAVGHEVDVTLTDFVADARAATPSQAAEMVVPDARARAAAVEQARARLVRAMRARLHEDRAVRDRLAHRVGDPRLAIAAFQQTLDDRQDRLESCARASLAGGRDAAASLDRRLAAVHPRAVILRERAILHRTDDRLRAEMRHLLGARRGPVAALAARLDAMSPLKVLGRGYSVVTNAAGKAVRDPGDVAPGDVVSARAAATRFTARVIEVLQGDPAANGARPGDTDG